MGFTNSPLVSYTRISPNKSDGRWDYDVSPAKAIDKITKVTIHHMAGVMSVEQFGNLVANPAREMSANYCIGSDGRIGLFCEEKDRSWCSSSQWNDNRAITIEVSNSEVSAEWPVSGVVYQSLIKLCIDICKRNGIKKLEFTGDRNGSLTYHYIFAQTLCPGPWIKAHTGDICAQVNHALVPGSQPTKELYRIRKTWTDAASQIGAYSNLENAKKACKAGYSVYGSHGNVVYSVPATAHASTPTPVTSTTTPKTESKPKADIAGLQKILNIGGAGLVVDGILGPKTVAAAKKYTVENGDTGNVIKWVQQRLNQLGFNCGVADGIAGVRTMNAIYSWQRANKIGVGYLGGSDWNHLLQD